MSNWTWEDLNRMWAHGPATDIPAPETFDPLTETKPFNPADNLTALFDLSEEFFSNIMRDPANIAATGWKRGNRWRDTQMENFEPMLGAIENPEIQEFMRGIAGNFATGLSLPAMVMEPGPAELGLIGEGLLGFAAMTPRIWKRIRSPLEEINALLHTAKASGASIADIRPRLRKISSGLYEDILEQQEGLRLAHGDRWYMDPENARDYDFLSEIKTRLDRLTGADEVLPLSNPRNISVDDLADRIINVKEDVLRFELEPNELDAFMTFRESFLPYLDQAAITGRAGSNEVVESLIAGLEAQVGNRGARSILRAMNIDDTAALARPAQRDIMIDAHSSRWGERPVPIGISDILADPLTAEPFEQLLSVLSRNGASPEEFVTYLSRNGVDAVMRQIEPWADANKIDKAGLLQALRWLHGGHLETPPLL